MSLPHHKKMICFALSIQKYMLLTPHKFFPILGSFPYRGKPAIAAAPADEEAWNQNAGE